MFLSRQYLRNKSRNSVSIIKYYTSIRLNSTENNIDSSSSYRFYPGKLPIIDITVGKLFEKACKEFKNRECVVSVHQNNIRLTYNQVLERADKLAAGLKKLNLKYGDRVGVWGPNDYQWLLAFIAISRAGCIMVGINPAYQQNELNYCLNKVQVNTVIAPDKFRTQDYGKMLIDAKNTCPSLKNIILWTDNSIKGTYRFSDIESLATNVEIEGIKATQNEISPYDGCNIQFTSGTTGYPKAPLLSHRSFVNNGRQIVERAGLINNNIHHKVCLNVPFFHAFGMIHGCMAGFYAGMTFVLESPIFNPKNSIETIVNEKCTVAYGTPTMWVNMLDMQEKLQARISSLHLTTTGGAIVSPELMKKIRNTFKVDKPTIIYGLTENTAVVFHTVPEDPHELTDYTVGRLHDHIEAKVVDENGQTIPIGTPGELWTRGYSTMIGYWNDPENTSKTIDEAGWLKSGDKFILHANGYGEVVGRLKDIIIRGGENIFPKEIEGFLESHNDIIEAQVFGVHDDVYGEEICACIRLKNNKKKITLNDIKLYAKGKISHFKIPRYIHFVEEFPKTTSGKIQKFKLKQLMEINGIIPPSKGK
ncbi:medium-chain acyl-CoA ligase ACSF2, mitochondrial isoform X1 [Microplitis demolitor]|uniref:medium-chain acyl-CoA ligase ACSF2, mitochondrial isoform X1 n=1 Tax=Microplitis demolitor TaxID=69319 RepID=UPI0004CD7842|nr:medium-chain acyl-CoA ligase ACSF2, mitochondrial isoform X1 [Microplitis demolitor]